MHSKVWPSPVVDIKNDVNGNESAGFSPVECVCMRKVWPSPVDTELHPSAHWNRRVFVTGLGCFVVRNKDMR